MIKWYCRKLVETSKRWRKHIPKGFGATEEREITFQLTVLGADQDLSALVDAVCDTILEDNLFASISVNGKQRKVLITDTGKRLEMLQEGQMEGWRKGSHHPDLTGHKP